MRLSIRALEAETAQQAFELGYPFSDALEVVTGERRSRIGVRATTVAVRCPVRRSAISPNVSPGAESLGRLATRVVTSASPRSTK